MGELNLQALAQSRENSAAACKVLPSGADLAAPLGSQSDVKPEFMGPQNQRDGKHPDALINVFRSLLDNMQHAMHRVAMYSGTRESMKHKGRSKMCMSDEQLHTLELCIYHGIKVQVEGLDGEYKSQMCRCTGSQSWRRGDPRNDWVWVKQRLGRCYGALNRRLPWQLQQLFKIKLPNEDGAFVEHWLSMALTTIPENLGTLDPVSQCEHVSRAPVAVTLQVVTVGNIIGCVHIIPEIARSTKTGDRRNM